MAKWSDEIPKSGGGDYFRTKDMEQGKPYRLRVLCEPVAGYVGWKGNRPVRKRKQEKVSGPAHFAPGEVEVSDKQRVSYFRAFAVYDYQDSKVKVWEVTQGSILGAIRDLALDADYGGPKEDATRFDVKVSKTGSGLDTEYTLLPSPPKDMDAKAVAAWDEVNAKGFDLNALFAGGNPFDPQNVPPTVKDGVLTFAEATGQKDEDIPF